MLPTIQSKKKQTQGGILMGILTSIVLTLFGGFILLLLTPELQKVAKTIRKKPYETFTVVGLCIVIAGVVKLAFLQG